MVIESVVQQLKIPTKMIDFVLTPFNKNSWVVAFKEGIDCGSLIGLNIIIGDESVKIEDYNSLPQKFKVKYDTYKILWLFHRQDLMNIQKFILILIDSRDTSLSSIASTSPCKDDAKMDVETENGKETSSSELKESAEGKSKKKKKKKTNKPYQS